MYMNIFQPTSDYSEVKPDPEPYGAITPIDKGGIVASPSEETG